MSSGGMVGFAASGGIVGCESEYIALLRRHIPSSEETNADQQAKARRELKAWKLADRLLNKLGFERIFDGRRASWVLDAGDDLLCVDESGQVFIGGEFKCLATPADAVHGDLIVSKVLSLATKARHRISTLNWDDRKILDRLLPIEKSRQKLLEAIREGSK